MRTGLQSLLADVPPSLRGARVGLLTQAAGVDAAGRSAVDLLAACTGLRLVRLFAPEHGLRGECPEGAAIADGVDGPTGLPVLSLYGEADVPGREAALFDGLDAVLVDVQDIGCRYYTYPGTIRRMARRAASAGVPVHVLDRPNPLGAGLAGPVRIEPALRSLVSAFDVPVRHAMTVGELALWGARDDGLDAHAVTVHRVTGWRRSDRFTDWGRPWVPPSPNSACWEMAELYPGTCLIEGTDLSEGRGTAYPFRQIGAPWVDAPRLARRIRERLPEGLYVRAVWFLPTAGKHSGTVCQGVFLDVLPGRPQPAPAAGLIAVARMLEILLSEGHVRFPAQGGTHWIDRLLGGPALRQALQAGRPLDPLFEDWRAACAGFAADRSVDLYGA